MTHRTYPQGVPCWIDTEQPDVAVTAEFYDGFFGWRRAPSSASGRPSDV